MMIRVGDYFIPKRGNATEISTKTMSSSKNSVRLLSATGYNNGGELFVVPKSNETIYENALTIGNNGSVGLGRAFFHSYKFIATSDVTVLLPKDNHKISVASGLYLKTVLEKQRLQFAYGFKLSNDRLKSMLIQVPLNDDLSIDWYAMDSRIEKIIPDIPVFTKSENKIEKSLQLTGRQWKSFSIESVVGSPVSGKDYPQYLRIMGETPFVGSSAKNNGVTNFIDKNEYSPDKFAKNVISVNRNGSVGFSFFHPYEAYFSGDTRYLDLGKKNKYIALFLTTAIMQQKGQFGYGFKLGTERLKNLKINLPVNDDELPDWKFMENYIKTLPNGDLI
ncbi:restriction endonuclease subunit S [Lactiplantibacillus plantarum]|uniref:restriction endonuclease subunit S n=1 Tax=Lactiplantibacillus plantarum TaxID=1590 RepID=UPI001BAC133D|nr:restriction endonuclease subunit S [Lactiplantibacillus plantarum]MBS0955640.1 restriction endonuclease subunit S [Lactiplantibacillus plantarum]